MKRMVGVVLVAACGGGTAGQQVANHAETATSVAPVLEPAWADLVAGSYSVDLDGDGTREAITVEGSDNGRVLTIDGNGQSCGEAETFDTLAILDLDPTTPGLDVYGTRFLSDADYQHCFFYKHGTVQSLAVYGAMVEGKLVLVNGNCSDEPTVWERGAAGFTERKELADAHQLETSCCDSEDCP